MNEYELMEYIKHKSSEIGGKVYRISFRNFSIFYTNFEIDPMYVWFYYNGSLIIVIEREEIEKENFKR